MSIQRILANNRNAIATATLTASTVKPSAAIFPGKAIRQGSGSVRLAGAYTGHEDASIDLRIISDLGSGRISAPVFAGIGSGRVVDVSASDVPAQNVEVELVSLGTESRSAVLDFYGVQLQAKASGAPGNSINLFVREELTATPSQYSLLADISAGEDVITGEEWEWPGITRILSASGTIPADCPRIRFQGDPTVYRQYKEYTSEGWKYHLSPAPASGIPAGAKISIITGSRTVTVSDGTTTEIYTGIVTLYDFLSALRNRSNVCTVQGVVSENLTPGGMASLDLPLRTSATTKPPTVDGWYELKDFADTLEVRADAPTEIITLNYLGDGAWSVKGSVSGSLPNARTGVAYSAATSPVSFTIPKPSQTTETSSDMETNTAARLLAVKYASRDEDAGEVEPPIIIGASKLGINGVSQVITATYRKNRAALGCEVEPTPVAFSNYCLGLPEGGDFMALDPAYASRLQALYQWRHDFIVANTSSGAGEDNSISRYKVSYEYNTAAEYYDPTWRAKTEYFTSSEAAYAFITRYSVNDRFRNWGPIESEVVVPGTAGSGAVNYQAAATDIAWMERCISLLRMSLELVFTFPMAVSMWDSLKSQVFSDLAALKSSAQDEIQKAQNEYLARYSSQIDLIYLAAGIVPGKTDGSDTSAGCWSDMDSEYYWELSDGYAPAFTDEVYYSTTRDGQGTKEFAFVISCACPDYLKEGDALTISIAGATSSGGSSVSANITIPIIAGTAVYLTGGMDGDNTRTWDVRGSVTRFPQLLMSASPARYNEGGLSFALADGGIPFALGDKFAFSIEGGAFSWRKNNGDWSEDLPIGSVFLADGLGAVFTPGTYPSFVAGDIFSFTARQSHAPANLRTPSLDAWHWPDSAAQITADFGAPTVIDAIALARHTLPENAEITIERSDNGIDWTPVTSLSAAGQVPAFVPEEPFTTLSLRLTMDTAGSIGWIFAGQALTTELAPDTITLRKQYDLTHGPREGAIYGGRGSAGLIEWINFISKPELDAHVTAIEHCKMNGDLPLVVIPHYLHPEEAMLVTVDTDDIDIIDELQFHPDNPAQRILSLSLPLAAVMQ